VKAILSVDLASRRYRDIGKAVVRLDHGELRCEFVKPALEGAPSPPVLGAFLKGTAAEAGASTIFIDGPQGWKDPANGLEHARVCERELHTPGKTGLPGRVKPASWTYMAEFSIALFNELDALGFSRLNAREDMGKDAKLAIESFPTSAWRTMGLKPLPGKSKTSAGDVQRWLSSLQQLIPINLARDPNHDELQALVAALAGLTGLGLPSMGCSVAGRRPLLMDGLWREGFVVNPTQSPQHSSSSPSIT